MSLEIKQSAVSLSPEEVMQLERIMTDCDREEALQFLRNNIYRKIATSQSNRLACHLDGGGDPINKFKDKTGGK